MRFASGELLILLCQNKYPTKCDPGYLESPLYGVEEKKLTCGLFTLSELQLLRSAALERTNLCFALMADIISRLPFLTTLDRRLNFWKFDL